LSAGDGAVQSAGGLLGGSGATITATGEEPLVDLYTSTLAVGDGFAVGLLGGSLTLAGPLLSSDSSTVTGGVLGLDGAQLVSNGTAPLLQFSGGSVATGASQATVGARGSADLNLAGGLLRGVGTTFSADLLLGLGDDGNLTSAAVISTGTGPLLQLESAAVSAWGVAGLWAGSSAELAGPLLDAFDSTIALTSGPLLELSGSTLTSSGTEPLLGITAGQITYSGFSPAVVHLRGGATGPSVVQLAGPLLLMSGVTLGGAGGPNALLGMGGGSSLTGSGTGELVHLANLGPFDMDHPLVRLGESPIDPVTSISNAGGLVKLDTTTLNAAGPVIQALRGALNLNTAPNPDPNVGAINLYQSAVTSMGPAFVLDRSDLTIHNGPLFSVTGGSVANIGGDFARLLGESRLHVTNGPLISADGPGSAVNVAGALVNFQGLNNQVFIKNSVTPTQTVSSIPVSGSNITIGPHPVLGGTIQAGTVPSGSNTLTINPGSSVIRTTNGGAVTITAP
ncbi:MAG: hypothetical protein WC713_02120, partial [Candidatus Methylomirabilota bacterium]